ncbi:MAG TPA: hypothetical protein VK615_05610, partial [Candidatus Binatia bacterium]|nr:hypothetical protein [Candidatus Binatia bacterium]
MHSQLLFRALQRTLLITCATVLGVSGRAMPAPVTIGDTQLEIPAPAGFSPVTSAMTELDKLLHGLVPPMNAYLTAFVADADVDRALKHEMPDLSRYFGVQTLKQLTSRFLTKSDFATIKGAIQKQQEKIMEEVHKQTPGLIESINKNLAKDMSVDLGLKSLNMVPLPPHEDTERSLGFSMLVNYTAAGNSGAAQKEVSAVTGTVLHLKGKILYLYANGGEKDLQWTRKVSSDWARAVIAANPSDAATASKES